MKIEVLGPGCQRCSALFERVRLAAGRLGIDCELHKVTDITAMTDYGVMATPALVIDGQVKLSGRLPSDSELTAMLSAAAADQEQAG